MFKENYRKVFEDKFNKENIFKDHDALLRELKDRKFAHDYQEANKSQNVNEIPELKRVIFKLYGKQEIDVKTYNEPFKDYVINTFIPGFINEDLMDTDLTKKINIYYLRVKKMILHFLRTLDFKNEEIMDVIQPTDPNGWVNNLSHNELKKKFIETFHERKKPKLQEEPYQIQDFQLKEIPKFERFTRTRFLKIDDTKHHQHLNDIFTSKLFYTYIYRNDSITETNVTKIGKDVDKYALTTPVTRNPNATIITGEKYEKLDYYDEPDVIQLPVIDRSIVGLAGDDWGVMDNKFYDGKSYHEFVSNSGEEVDVNKASKYKRLPTMFFFNVFWENKRLVWTENDQNITAEDIEPDQSKQLLVPNWNKEQRAEKNKQLPGSGKAIFEYIGEGNIIKNPFLSKKWIVEYKPLGTRAVEFNNRAKGRQQGTHSKRSEWIQRAKERAITLNERELPTPRVILKIWYKFFIENQLQTENRDDVVVMELIKIMERNMNTKNKYEIVTKLLITEKLTFLFSVYYMIYWLFTLDLVDYPVTLKNHQMYYSDLENQIKFKAALKARSFSGLSLIIATSLSIKRDKDDKRDKDVDNDTINFVRNSIESIVKTSWFDIIEPYKINRRVNRKNEFRIDQYEEFIFNRLSTHFNYVTNENERLSDELLAVYDDLNELYEEIIEKENEKEKQKENKTENNEIDDYEAERRRFEEGYDNEAIRGDPLIREELDYLIDEEEEEEEEEKPKNNNNNKKKQKNDNVQEIYRKYFPKDDLNILIKSDSSINVSDLIKSRKAVKSLTGKYLPNTLLYFSYNANHLYLYFGVIHYLLRVWFTDNNYTWISDILFLIFESKLLYIDNDSILNTIENYVFYDIYRFYNDTKEITLTEYETKIFANGFLEMEEIKDKTKKDIVLMLQNYIFYLKYYVRIDEKSIPTIELLIKRKFDDNFFDNLTDMLEKPSMLSYNNPLKIIHTIENDTFNAHGTFTYQEFFTRSEDSEIITGLNNNNNVNLFYGVCSIFRECQKVPSIRDLWKFNYSFFLRIDKQLPYFNDNKYPTKIINEKTDEPPDEKTKAIRDFIKKEEDYDTQNSTSLISYNYFKWFLNEQVSKTYSMYKNDSEKTNNGESFIKYEIVNKIYRKFKKYEEYLNTDYSNKIQKIVKEKQELFKKEDEDENQYFTRNEAYFKRDDLLKVFRKLQGNEILGDWFRCIYYSIFYSHQNKPKEFFKVWYLQQEQESNNRIEPYKDLLYLKGMCLAVREYLYHIYDDGVDFTLIKDEDALIDKIILDSDELNGNIHEITKNSGKIDILVNALINKYTKNDFGVIYQIKNEIFQDFWLNHKDSPRPLDDFFKDTFEDRLNKQDNELITILFYIERINENLKSTTAEPFLIQDHDLVCESRLNALFTDITVNHDIHYDDDVNPTSEELVGIFNSLKDYDDLNIFNHLKKLKSTPKIAIATVYFHTHVAEKHNGTKIVAVLEIIKDFFRVSDHKKYLFKSFQLMSLQDISLLDIRFTLQKYNAELKEGNFSLSLINNNTIERLVDNLKIKELHYILNRANCHSVYESYEFLLNENEATNVTDKLKAISNHKLITDRDKLKFFHDGLNRINYKRLKVNDKEEKVLDESLMKVFNDKDSPDAKTVKDYIKKKNKKQVLQDIKNIITPIEFAISETKPKRKKREKKQIIRSSLKTENLEINNGKLETTTDPPPKKEKKTTTKKQTTPSEEKPTTTTTGKQTTTTRKKSKSSTN